MGEAFNSNIRLRRPRVMQVVLSLDPGGTERLVVDLVRAAREACDVTVCCLDAPGRWGEELRREGVEVIALDRAPGFHPALGFKIAREARARGVRLLHCHHYSPFIYGALAKLASPRLRVIYTEHGRLSDARPTVKRRLVTPLFDLAAAATFSVSEDLRRYLLDAGFSRRMKVITNGITIGRAPDATDRAEARRRLGVPDGACVVGAVGRLDSVKDFPMLLQSFAPLAAARPAVYLVIVGDGQERAALEKLRGDMAHGDRILMLGHRDDVRSLLPGFDVFVNSSISEGISLTLLEAMAACLPIVATRVGGTPEVVEDGETGLLVPPRDPEACAHAVAQLLGAPDRRARMAVAGRARVEQVFSTERMTGAYLELYRQLSYNQ
jgi:glycosyltransferase involved in cell wall biosynthesis